MRGVLSADRTVVSELLASYENATGGSLSKEAKRGAGLRIDSKISLIRRYVSPTGLRRYASVVLIIAALVSAFFSTLIAQLVAPVIVCLCGLIGLQVYVAGRERRRHAALERDLPALLTSVASSVRAGIDPLRAIVDSQEYFPSDSPFVAEVRLFKERIAAGDDEFEVVESFLSGDAHPDVELFKRCIVLSRRHGSSLADPLHRVVRVVRQRQSFRRKTRAALAMHRMSAIGIALCALLIAVMQAAMNAKGVALAFKSPAGLVLISVGGVLISVGVGWMLCMGQEERL
jgi:tight adherence protein B